MRLAVSNIAWSQADDTLVFELLRGRGVAGIEVAPTKVWPDWQGATEAAADAYRRRLADEGFMAPSLQSILYGRPELNMFDPGVRRLLLEHLRRVADLAAALGAGPMVFGAPKNRRRGPLSTSEAMPLAVDVLREIGALCVERGVCLAFEPNPIEYGCDFVTNLAEGRAIVDLVASPGVQLHVDAADVHLYGGTIEKELAAAVPFVHFHASEPYLDWSAAPKVDHRRFASALRAVGYDGWVAIEMRPGREELSALTATLDHVCSAYGFAATRS